MRKTIIFYARKRVEDTQFSFYVLYQEKARHYLHLRVKNIIYFSWHIITQKPIDLKLEKWHPLRVMVTLFTL